MFLVALDLPRLGRYLEMCSLMLGLPLLYVVINMKGFATLGWEVGHYSK